MFSDLEELKDVISQGGFVGLAQINPIAGNLKYNAEKITEFIKKAEDAGLDLIVFPEYSLLGSSMKDFVKRYPFILDEEQKVLEQIAELTARTTAIIGFVDADEESAFAILRWGRVDKILKKAKFFSSKILNDGVEYYIRSVSIPSKTSKNSPFFNLVSIILSIFPSEKGVSLYLIPLKISE